MPFCSQAVIVNCIAVEVPSAYVFPWRCWLLLLLSLQKTRFLSDRLHRNIMHWQFILNLTIQPYASLAIFSMVSWCSLSGVLPSKGPVGRWCRCESSSRQGHAMQCGRALLSVAPHPIPESIMIQNLDLKQCLAQLEQYFLSIPASSCLHLSFCISAPMNFLSSRQPTQDFVIFGYCGGRFPFFGRRFGLGVLGWYSVLGRSEQKFHGGNLLCEWWPIVVGKE